VSEGMKCTVNTDFIGVMCGNCNQWKKWKLTVMEKERRDNRKDKAQLGRHTPQVQTW
jgi:hypothetical protein